MRAPNFFKAQSDYFMADVEMYRSWSRKQTLLDIEERTDQVNKQLIVAEDDFKDRVKVRDTTRKEYIKAGAVI
jgi:hypothetical protein